MIIEHGHKFIISSHSYEPLMDILKRRTEKFRYIMERQIMTRVIYRLPVGNNFDGKGEHQWLRIRAGDVDCNGNSRCTITYRKKDRSQSNAEITKLEVEDFYEATHMFDMLGFQRSSEQETERTKIVCTFENVKYTISFDRWPRLDEQLFVTIRPGSNAEDTDLKGFVTVIKMNDFALPRHHVDVDSEYQNRYGYIASEMPQIRFESFGTVKGATESPVHLHNV